MPFDDATRGRLQRFVGAARALLTEEFARQLQQDYGLDPSTGDVAAVDSLTDHDDWRRETAGILREIMQHYLTADFASGREGRLDVLDRIVREQAFTVLNRLAALRMMEARGILIESVAKGYQSRGFQLYQRVVNGALGETGEAYRCFLFSVFDTFAADLPALFDRHAPQGRLFPREAALLAVLEEFDAPDLEPLWGEDETIGWIYQYFNSKEERQAMRRASQAPRNSHELAVRNQFFTPRYVVEFLVDNTLGRLWFNWTGGVTSLRDRCQYLLVRPDEQPEAAGRLRDPRTIKLLDPACGSMHFGLYAFDLFLEIYREAWAWEAEQGPGSLDTSTQPEAALKPLSEAYPDEAAFLRDAPRLIIEHNIYGVEIDPRAAQIASLALWLRAQRAWYDVGVKAADRPAIGRGNVVAAVAPPAEVDLRKELIAEMDTLDAELFENTLVLLKGLPELGVLLRVERELPALVRRAYGEHGDLFRSNDEVRWRKAETRLSAALSQFVQATRSTYQGRLFAQDALEGLRLIELTRGEFDVVTMNPPFGELSRASKDYIFASYGESKYDIAATFWTRTTQLVSKEGKIGCLANRTIFFGQMLEGWRNRLFITEGSLESSLDLGLGVLDDAMVEATASVSFPHPLQEETVFIKESERPETVLRHVIKFRQGTPTENTYQITTKAFSKLPASPFAYWLPASWLSAYSRFLPLENQGIVVKQGMESSDNFRFVRLWWEPSSKGTYWRPYSKGGSFGPQWHDLDVSINWKEEGAEVKSFSASIYGTWSKQITNSDRFGKAGIVYPASRVEFSPRIVQIGNVIGRSPIVLFDNDEFSETLYFRLLAILSSSSFRALVNLTTTRGDTTGKSYRERAIAQTPSPNVTDVPISAETIVVEIVNKIRLLESGIETKRNFRGLLSVDYKKRLVSSVRNSRNELDAIIAGIYGFKGQDYLAWRSSGYDDLKEYESQRRHELISYLVGCAFGRWNLRRINEGDEDEDGSESPFLPIPVIVDSRGRSINLALDPGNPYPPDLLVSDASSSKDLASIVSALVGKLFGDRAEIKEQEMLQTLGVESLTQYLLRYSGFFDAHLKDYTTSRRQAPIYWPLSTVSGGYTVWLYHPALTDETLYTAANDFIGPKLETTSRLAAALRIQTNRNRDEERQLEQLQDLEAELKELQNELLRLAPTWKPNHDDGVQITAAPLWRLFRHRPWQMVLKETWEKLEKGDYDWAHLAMAYWPDRVREKCRTDKSLAIAHDLEDLYEPPPEKPGAGRRGRKRAEAA